MKRVIQYTGLVLIIGLLCIFLFKPDKAVNTIQSSEIVKVTSRTIDEKKLVQNPNEVAKAPQNFNRLRLEEEITIDDPSYVAEEDLEGNPQLHSYGHQVPTTIDTPINLLTGEDLWLYRPYLLDKVKQEQGISMLPIDSIVEINNELLSDLTIGDSLIFTMPNGAEQQIIISKINIISDKVTSWDLQNTQRQDIGKITQISNLTEGSFITDSKDEYHLRTVNNKGWITSKSQLMSNNDNAVKRNSEAFSELLK
ncbi:hypothetical protein [Photobacterium angustum]|uniref:hypothetical protein n=1 Tax=Photobacterium angustum TaxID=661 RepID=UPI0005E9851F|nr:hypothetical protein [Photobacterium angustum]KJG19142.1 hypothetical protein UA33_03755 [Photobacterium angustum]KJG25166.1 hypothetical protein UA39_04215 [Photobacterium angustum]KJG33472.1 hypothetical protein UA36_00265 [Photobacterium angustum]PSW96132.1 hypothetical protein C0W79_08825 [Photobacterium angustum]PSX00331.1 hypothetical protein C0W87_18790 [Photobacterium angustum]